eukprot:TRINITY_DN10730_c0_g1_i1.p1 TRINITY_DN10730_c0_g1~~TRINITY_DN10730_c0_g1_i1.p1  ORF type:complete len:145 (+),score=13.35 TRINITY_DN10730_c0_g1_i1:196-630(+)
MFKETTWKALFPIQTILPRLSILCTVLYFLGILSRTLLLISYLILLVFSLCTAGYLIHWNHNIGIMLLIMKHLSYIKKVSVISLVLIGLNTLLNVDAYVIMGNSAVSILGGCVMYIGIRQVIVDERAAEEEKKKLELNKIYDVD